MHRDCMSEDTACDARVLELLLEDHPGLWSVEEIARSLGDRPATDDALARLQAAGLVHRCAEFAFATRAAAHAYALPR